MIAERLEDGTVVLSGTLPADPDGLLVAGATPVSGGTGRVVAVYLTAEDVTDLTAEIDSLGAMGTSAVDRLLAIFQLVLP